MRAFNSLTRAAGPFRMMALRRRSMPTVSSTDAPIESVDILLAPPRLKLGVEMPPPPLLTPAEPKAGSCGLKLSLGFVIWEAVSRPTISLTSAYFSGTTSNTSPGASLLAAGLAGAAETALGALTVVIVTARALGPSGTMSTWIGAPPFRVRVRSVSFCVKLMAWRGPYLPAGGVAPGTRPASMIAIRLTSESFVRIEDFVTG